MKMAELRLRELREVYSAQNLNEVVEGIDLALKHITGESDIGDAQVLPKGTLLASLTESYIKQVLRQAGEGRGIGDHLLLRRDRRAAR